MNDNELVGDMVKNMTLGVVLVVLAVCLKSCNDSDNNMRIKQFEIEHKCETQKEVENV